MLVGLPGIAVVVGGALGLIVMAISAVHRLSVGTSILVAILPVILAVVAIVLVAVAVALLIAIVVLIFGAGGVVR